MAGSDPNTTELYGSLNIKTSRDGEPPLFCIDGVPLAGSGSIVTTAISVLLGLSNGTVLCDATSGSITITLPAAATSGGHEYNIKKIDSSANSVIIDANASELIDGGLTATINPQWTSLTIKCDGTAWYIL